jgi:hypothetical protein
MREKGGNEKLTGENTRSTAHEPCIRNGRTRESKPPKERLSEVAELIMSPASKPRGRHSRRLSLGDQTVLFSINSSTTPSRREMTSSEALIRLPG